MNYDLIKRLQNTELFHDGHKFSRGEALLYLCMQADQEGNVERNVYQWTKDWNWPRTNVYRFLEYLQKHRLIESPTGQVHRTGTPDILPGQGKIFIKLSFPESYEENEENTGQVHRTGTPDILPGQGSNNGKVQNNGSENTSPESIQKRIEYELESLSQEEVKKWEGYQQYLNDEGLYRIKLIKQPLTPKQLVKIIARYGSDMVAEKLKAIENVPDCHEKYVSLYLTLESWCSKEIKRELK